MKPAEVMLVDLQLARLSSLVTDIHHVLYTNANTIPRNKYLKNILELYYKTYEEVVAKSGLPIPFTLNELEDEYYSKCDYGFMIGLFMLPIVSQDEGDLVEIDQLNDEKEAAESVQKQDDKLVELFKTGGVFRNCMVEIFEEMLNLRK